MILVVANQMNKLLLKQNLLSRAKSIDMPFEEFRQKLPANITDDIANIIYYNSSAFADFANIETQDDVYSFNSKYDVNLTLPFNTETT